MDIRGIELHYSRMNNTARSTDVPAYRLYRESREEAGDFWIHVEPIPARTRLHRYEIAAHRHPALLQMFRTTAGEGEIFDGAAHIGFRAPAVLFIPPGAVHGFRFSRDVDGLVVTVLADRLGQIAATDRQVARFAEAIRVVPLEGADDALTRIDGEMRGQQAGRMAALQALVALAIVDLARGWGAGQEHAVARDGVAMRIERLQELIAANFRAARPVSFYAEALGLSTAQLNRVTRAATGRSVHELVALRIVEAARRDLVFTPTPVNRIAESLGFADPAYFNRFFRRQTGMTPGAFRMTERGRLG